MINKTKIALIAAVAAMGIASPAFAQLAGPSVQYQLPSEAPDFGTQTAPQTGSVAHRRLYNSTVIPGSAVLVPNDNWVYDAQSSSASRGDIH